MQVQATQPTGTYQPMTTGTAAAEPAWSLNLGMDRFTAALNNPTVASTPTIASLQAGVPVEMTAANFNQLVMQSARPVVVEFYSPACAASSQLAPATAALARQRPDVTVARVNGVQQGALARQFGVTSVPTVLVFKNGRLAGKGVPGAPTLAALDALLAAGKI